MRLTNAPSRQRVAENTVRTDAPLKASFGMQEMQVRHGLSHKKYI